MTEERIINCETLVINKTDPLHCNCRKRPAIDTNDETKRLKVQNESGKVDKQNNSVTSKEESNCNNKEEPTSLLVFSDDILLMIISNLNHQNIINLSKTCTRLHRICQDHTLWRDVNFGDHIVTQTEMNVILKYVSTETKSIYLKGYHESEGGIVEDTLSVEWLSEIREKCTSLLSLSLPNHYIDGKDINIHQYPRTLVKLDLSNTYLRDHPKNKSYFKDLSTILPDLEVLILSNCHWFEPHSMMALSKCPKLKELRLDNCIQFKDCVAYVGLATRGGFKALKTLDLRKCPVGSSELNCFTSVNTIVNLYLESPTCDGSIQIDTPIKILFTAEPMIEIRLDGNQQKVACPRLKIEKLAIRNYKEMTDTSLDRLAREAIFLKYLDVTGSGVTADGIERFRTLRPNVTLVNDNL